jgi:ankyrin repeat protein
MSSWGFLNESLCELMSCGVEKQWFQVINALIYQHCKFHYIFAVRQKGHKSFCNLLEYALKFNHKKTFQNLIIIFLDQISMDNENVTLNMVCNGNGDTIFHLLIRYNAFDYLDTRSKEILFPSLEIFMHHQNVKGESVLSLMCKLSNKDAIFILLQYRFSLFDFFLKYFYKRLNFEMVNFLCNNFKYSSKLIYDLNWDSC